MLSLFYRWSYWTCTSSELRRPTAIAAAPLTSPLTVNGGRVRSEAPRMDAGGGFPRQSLTSFRLPPSLSFPLLLITTRAPLRFSSSLEGDPRSNIFVVQFLLPASALETFECNCGLVFSTGGEGSQHIWEFLDVRNALSFLFLLGFPTASTQKVSPPDLVELRSSHMMPWNVHHPSGGNVIVPEKLTSNRLQLFLGWNVIWLAQWWLWAHRFLGWILIWGA